MSASQSGRSLVAWGSYDAGKPRVRLLLDELRRRDALAAEINIPVWAGIEDKSVAGPLRLLGAGVRLLLSYPRALWRLLRQPAGGVLLLPYPAIPDVFLVRPVAALRRHKILVDAFIPFHDTIVRDRRLVSAGGMAAKVIWWIERKALRLADVILVDTDQHGDFLAGEFRLDRGRFETVLVGAEPIFWDRSAAGPAPEMPFPQDPPIVLFYGQLIPLHGLETILQAVRLTSADPFHWVIVGSGQEEAPLREFVAGAGNLSWIPWIDYDRLPDLIARATVALGIFGSSDKAARVIPNKLFQVLAMGKPIITRESPAVGALAARFPDTIVTVPPGDAEALAKAVRDAIRDPARLRALPVEERRGLGPELGVLSLLARLRQPAQLTGGGR